MEQTLAWLFKKRRLSCIHELPCKPSLGIVHLVLNHENICRFAEIVLPLNASGSSVLFKMAKTD